MSNERKILSPEYLKGHEFTDKLKHVLNCRNFQELGEILNVPKSTFTTWNAHDRTSHELMVRLHLQLGVPLAELALSEEDRKKLPTFESSKFVLEESASGYSSATTETNPQHQTVIFKSYTLSNGKLIPTGEIPYPKRMLNGWQLNEYSTLEIETNDGRFLIDESQNDPVSGEYLLDINGRLSINHIQRLPNKLAIVFGDSTVEVSEEDIKVIGRVAVTLKKN